MLNYTSKIQHFLNLHRKHTKYIVVLLLLSAFVASFVCSALTEPAVSMTNQSFDITTNLSVDSDGATQDGLPIIDESYSSGQFSGYMNEAAPLGIATRFGLFAFESVDIIAHCNTNLATPNATIGAPFGSSQIAAEGGQEITLITDSLSIGDITSNNTVLLFPESVNFVDEQDNFVSINPLPRVKINNGETKHINQGSTKMYAYHVRKEAFINWTEEKNNYIERQNDWINKNGTADNYSIYVKAWYDENDENNKTISRIEIPNEGEYYLYIPYNKLPNGSRELNITLGKNVTLIINVDLSGAGETYDANFQITGSQGGSNFTNESSALEKGMNLLWNFYDSSDNQNNQYTGTINMVKPGVGCIVAPSANVNIDASFAGTIVANKIKTTATFSKSMFKTVVIAEETDIAVMAHKEWDDGKENHTNDSVTVQLYKSLSPNASLNDLKDSDKVGELRTLNAGNNWNDTWFGLDRSYYYYVKEISTGNYYCETEYGNNGRDTTGTITVKNKVIKTEEIDPNAKLDLTIQMYWSDDAKAHTYCNGDGCDCDVDPNNKIQHKNKTVLIYRSTSKDFNPANLTNAEQKREYSIVKKDDNDNYIQENTMLYYDSEEGTTSTFIDSRDDWKKTITGLPVMNSSKQIYYYYAVFPYNTGGIYMFEYSNNGVSGKSDTITVGCIKMLQLTVNKNWEDDNNTSDNGEVAYKVYQSRTKADYRPSDAKEIAEIKNGSNNLSFNLNNSNNWKASIDRSPQLPQSTIYGEKYYYYVEETSISGSELNKYNISYTNNGFNDDAAVTINNQKKEAGNFSIKVTKNKPNALKAATTAVLYRITTDGNWDNAEKVGTQPLSESNNWQCTFTALPLKEKDSSKSYYYKVVEDGSSPGFNVTYSNQVIDTSGITENVEKQVDIYYNEKTVTINVKKIWNNISPDLIKHVIVKVYRYKGDINAQAIGNYLSSNSDFTFLNNYNVLDDTTYVENEITFDFQYNQQCDLSNQVNQNISEKYKGMTLIKALVYYDNCTTFTNTLAEFMELIKIQVKNSYYQDVESSNAEWDTEKITINYNSQFDISVFLISNYNHQNFEKVELYFDNGKLTVNNSYYGKATIAKGEYNNGNTGGSTGGTTPTIPTGTLNGNILTFDYSSNPMSPNDTIGAFSRENYTFVYSLANAVDRQIKKVEIEFNENPDFGSNSNNYNLVFDNQTTLDNENNTNYGLLKWGYEFNGNQSGCSFDTNNHKITYEVGTNNDSNTSLREIEEDDYLVFTAGKSEPSFKIKKVIVTFADTGNSGGTGGNVITNGNTITVTPNLDTNGNYSPGGTQYNYYYQFNSEHIGKQITKIEVDFTGNLAEKRLFISTNPKDLQNTAPMVYKEIADESSQGMTISGNKFTYLVEDEQVHYQEGLRVIQNGDILVVEGNNNDFTVNSITITFAIHNQKYYPFSSGYVKEHTNIDDNNFHSKEVDYVELHFKSNSTEFAKWENYDFWLGDYGSRNAGTTGISQNNNVVKWDYDAVTSVYKIGARFIDSTNVEKIKIVYEDCSTYTINNTFSNSSAIHQSKDVTIKSGEQQYIDIDGNFHSKAVACLEMYFKSNSEDFKNYSKYDFWLGDYNSTNATTDEVIGIFERNPYYIVKRTYKDPTNPTNVNKIGVNFADSNNVHSIKIYYTDGSTYTINNTSNEYITGTIEDDFSDSEANLTVYSQEFGQNYYNLFQNYSLQSIRIYYENAQNVESNAQNFINNVLDVKPVQNWNTSLTQTSVDWDNGVIVKTYTPTNNITQIKLSSNNNNIEKLEKVELYFENGMLTFIKPKYGNTETLKHSETINVLSTNLNADGNLDYSKSLAWRIPDQFRGLSVQEIKAVFHNRNKLTREGTEYYNTVFNMNIYAINDNQLSENWKNNIDGYGNVDSKYISSFNDPDIYKRYLPKSYLGYSELDFLLICTAYTENLKQIVITFEGGHTITLTNGNAGTNIEEPLPYNPYDITLVETITLTADDDWEHILSNQPMVAPDGTPYYYVIEEIEIEYKDGPTLSSAISISNLFEVESTILNALELEENPENNVLTVTNKLKTTNTTMPSTGGIGTHPYRNAGILMMICSGGIYISLRALRKKQN